MAVGEKISLENTCNPDIGRYHTDINEIVFSGAPPLDGSSTRSLSIAGTTSRLVVDNRRLGGDR
jgi:hypothetical protein